MTAIAETHRPDDEPDETPDPGDQGDPERLEIDVRFLLANERTLLAWLRTTLAMLVAGVGLLHFLDDVPLNNTLGLVLLILGAAGSLIGWQRYRVAETAVRERRLPPRGVAPDAVALTLFAVSVVLVVVVVTHHVTTI